MKVIGIDSKLYNFAPGKPHSIPSSLHKKCLEIIKELYPIDSVWQEVCVLGGRSPLFFDFFLPLRKYCVEVDGRQHDEFVGYFHKDMVGYAKAMGRDKEKERFCELNGFHLVRLKERNQETWRDQLLGIEEI